MVEVTVKIPKIMNDIVSEMGEAMYVEALKVVAAKKFSDLQKRLDELNKKSACYELKYGKTYKNFSQNVPDTLEAHDDWMDWSYLYHVSKELFNKINRLKLLMGM